MTTFATIIEKIENKLVGWKEQLLSQGGKEILIKVAMMAIPIFAMSCFKLPLSLCHQINTLVANFWLGNKVDEGKQYWVAWDKVCTLKLKGGIGFKNLESFNYVLLVKQGWKILSNPDSLSSKVLKGCYFPYMSFFKAQRHNQSS
ncbi:uncharacterized mitochondrial protein AtMg00310-like [Hevea brasiliensis]|uniref:uncharacterized mitochondrial protein AtMg00310-like n=1 Tax=Hevea brasiliensis TaxID=3981 RepID=UPI0025FDBFD4|nr:uncharacterized mitochondrial protein AtMg00310-like [Hevea brasiliensis]